MLKSLTNPIWRGQVKQPTYFMLLLCILFLFLQIFALFFPVFASFFHFFPFFFWFLANVSLSRWILCSLLAPILDTLGHSLKIGDGMRGHVGPFLICSYPLIQWLSFLCRCLHMASVPLLLWKRVNMHLADFQMYKLSLDVMHADVPELSNSAWPRTYWNNR